jgi:adhesin transport system outer membrane protein
LHSIAGQAALAHPSIKAAEAQIRAAGYDLSGARWLRYPSLSVEALATTRGSAIATQDGTVLNVVLEQPLWTGGRIDSAIDRAEAQATMRRAMLDETVRTLGLRVVAAYFDLAGSERRVDVLDDVMAQHGELVATIARRVDQQVSPRSDLELARARTAQFEQQLVLATAQRQASLNALIELTGDSAPPPGPMPAYDPAVHHPGDDSSVAQALGCDPRTIRSRAEALVARADQKAAKAALYPQLVGQLSSNEILGERVGLALRAQTGNGLSRVAAADGARERVSASDAAVITAQRELREALRFDLVNNAGARARIVAAQTAAASSEAVTQSYQRQFIAGRRTWLDVMNSLQESASTRLALVDAETLAMATAARIRLQSCSWEPRARLEYLTEAGDDRR